MSSFLKNSRLRHFIDQHEPPDSLVLVITAVIVGISTGFLAIVFIWLLQQVADMTAWLQTAAGDALGLIIAMTGAGLLVGYGANRWAIEAKGSGIPEVIEALVLQKGRMRKRTIWTKIAAASLTIGTGGSAGREGPIVQVGSALGSVVGQTLHLSGSRVQALVACGAAAGISASFNAPIAGSLFALEVILNRFSTRFFGAVVISAVAASVTAHAYLGEQPAFIVPAYAFRPSELPIYIVLGILAALVSVTFVYLLQYFDKLFAGRALSPMLLAGAGMMLTAVIGLLSPNQAVLGPGLAFIGQAISDDINLSLGLMLSLLLLKMVATGFTLSSGNSGGLFAPSLFIGAILGGLVGSMAHRLWPEVAVNPGAYAIVGMAAVLSGTARSPITAVLIIFEMSNDYKLILPLMLATVLSTLLAEHLFTESIYTLKLTSKGITLHRGRDLDLLQSLSVAEVMGTDPYVVSQDMPVTELGRYLQKTHSHSFPVVDKSLQLVGMVSLSDYERALDQPDRLKDLCVGDIASLGQVLTAYADEPLSHAIQRLAFRGIHKMPVVTRERPFHVVGVIRRDDVVKAYNLALTRKAREQVEDETVHLRRISSMELLELEIPENSRAAHRTLASLASELPHDCVVVFVRRQGTILIPHGDTVLQPGDQVHAFLRESDEDVLKDCLLCELVRTGEENVLG